MAYSGNNIMNVIPVSFVVLDDWRPKFGGLGLGLKALVSAVFETNQ